MSSDEITADHDDDWEETIDGWKAEIESMPLDELLASFYDAES